MLLQQTVGVNLPVAAQIQKIYRDQTMDDNTASLVDFAGLWGRPAGVTAGAVIPVTKTLANYARSSASNGVSQVATNIWTGTGITHDVTGRTDLPTEFGLSTATTDVLIILWSKLAGTGLSFSDFNHLIAGTTLNAGSSSWKLTPTTASGAISSYSVTCRGQALVPSSITRAALFNGLVNQHAYRFTMSADRTQVQISMYLNGVLATQSGFLNASFDFPTTLGVVQPSLGVLTGYTTAGYPGTHYRAALHNLTTIGRTPAVIVAADYAANAARFS